VTSATRELLADRYRLEERIATGGMGVVWRARDERLERDVAVKLIRPEYADDPTFRQRLRLEARAIAAIRSPHVVHIHDVCEERDPAGGYRSFLVMELVGGAPLSAVLRDGTLPVDLTIEVMRQTASALAAAHEQQIIHRDIKPANIMVDPGGRVTVLDFGIARAADAVALTATDLILGTARYISPEQADGRGATAASDVYSLGVVAFQCLAGRVPFDAGSDVGVALAHLREPVPPLPSTVPAPIADLVTRMLAKAPEDRPTATDVAERLAALSAAPDTATSELTVPVPRVRRDLKQAATAVLPVVVAARHRIQGRLDTHDLKETRSAAARPRLLFATVAAVALVLALPLALAGGSGGLQPSVAAGTPNAHSATRHVVAPAKVTVSPTAYLGKPWPQVRRQLRALGLHPVAHFAGSGAGATVIGVAPYGKVAKGTTISVLVSRAGPASPAQHKAPASKHPKPPKPKGPGGHGPPGQIKKHHGPGH
jgi:serine/threonine-protein kinase